MAPKWHSFAVELMKYHTPKEHITLLSTGDYSILKTNHLYSKSQDAKHATGELS